MNAKEKVQGRLDFLYNFSNASKIKYHYYTYLCMYLSQKVVLFWCTEETNIIYKF